MQVQIEDVSPIQKKLSFVVDQSTVGGKLDEAYGNLARQVRLPGFRKGKVPRHLLEKRYGRAIAGEVASRVISDALQSALTDHKIAAVGQPVVDPGELSAAADYAFSVTVEVKPKLVVEGWDGMDVQWPQVVVPDAEIDAEIDAMRQREATMEAAEEGHEAAEEDMVWLDATLSAEGKEDQTLSNVMLVVGGQFGVVDYLDPLVRGLPVGGEKSATLELPESAPEGWAGVIAQVAVKVNEIKLHKMPALDDEFAGDVGFDSLEALRNDVRFKLEEARGQAARAKAAEWALDKLLEQHAFDVPEGLVRAEAETLLQQNLQQLAMRGMRMRQVRLEQLQDEARERLLREGALSARRALVLEAIADQAGVEVSDADMDAKIEEIAAEVGQQAAAIKGMLAKRGGTEELRLRLREEKALDLLLERANVVDAPPEAEDAAAEDAGAQP